MGLRNSSVLCLALMLSFSSAIHCIDITKTLGQYPNFALFNKYLTETKLVDQINSAKSVTVLVVEDKDLASLAGKPIDTIKTVIGTNIITDFYDEKRLLDAIGAKTELATLSPASGPAGKINCQLINEGEVTFASAVPGSKPDTFLVGRVAYEADVVSVLQVDKPILMAPSTASTATPSGAIPIATLSAETPRSVVAEAPAPSASSRTTFGFIAAVMAFASIFVSL